MIGVVLVTHGRIGEELKATAELILGPQMQVAAISVFGADSLQTKGQEISAALASVRDPVNDDGVLILTDLVGCTPSNLASSVERAGRGMVLTGVNLPMVMAVMEGRQRGSLDGVAKMGIAAGRKHIDVAPVRSRPLEA